MALTTLKSFQTFNVISFQAGELFIVDEILSELDEPLFKLKDLMNDDVPGFYYAGQLTKTAKPEEKDYFLVEKVLKEKTVKGKKFFFVKFLFYPPKFSQWIEEKNIKRGE